MKIMSRRPNSLVAVLLAATALAGCAAAQQRGRETGTQSSITQEEHETHHPQGISAQPSSATEKGAVRGQGGMMGGQGGMMSGGQAGMMGQGGRMDMKSMCEMHEKIKNSRTPQERGEMMDQTMKNMTPEMRQRHFEMMEQQCR